MDLRFVLIDNNSKDPEVRRVIRGFDRRGMFDRVMLCKKNDPLRMNKVLEDYWPTLGECFYFIESDVVVPDSLCWATEYDKVYRSYPDSAMIGSFCDKRDFIDPELIRAKDPNIASKDLEFFAKSRSPERAVTPQPGMDVWPFDTPTPPGRLTMLKTEAIREVGFLPDNVLAKAVTDKGYSYRICTTFQHRHLSLLNWFDAEVTDYGEKRLRFFRAMKQSEGVSTRMLRRFTSLLESRNRD